MDEIVGAIAASVAVTGAVGAISSWLLERRSRRQLDRAHQFAHAATLLALESDSNALRERVAQVQLTGSAEQVEAVTSYLKRIQRDVALLRDEVEGSDVAVGIPPVEDSGQ